MTAIDVQAGALLRLRPDRTEPLEALLAGAGPHLVEVLDVGSAANGDLLVELREPAVRLVELLLAPGGLTAGEAVTVLVPLAQALQRMHEQGVAHGGVGVAAVQLDRDGSPAWAVPEEPALLRRIGPTAFGERAASEVAAFRALCGTLLGPIGVPVPDGHDLGALAGALYAVAPAEPVRLERQTDPWPSAAPARLVPAARVDHEAVAGVARRLPAAALQALRSVRVRVWVAFGAAAALLVAALVLLPSGDDGRPAATSVATSARMPTPRPTVVAARALAGPAAVAALLAERDRCLAAADPACLSRVDAVGSPVLQADLAAVDAGVEAVRIDRSRLKTSTTGGGTALGTAGKATVLAVREQNGWRLRDVVAEPPADG
jgi:hypothetical protein